MKVMVNFQLGKFNVEDEMIKKFKYYCNKTNYNKT